jgi:hypothetical protein
MVHYIKLRLFTPLPTGQGSVANKATIKRLSEASTWEYEIWKKEKEGGKE